MLKSYLIALPLICLSILLGTAPAHADDPNREFPEHEEALPRDQLHDLVQKGELLSLAALKALTLSRVPGKLIDVSVKRDDGAIIYELRVLRDGGQVTEVEIDATSGRIIEIENE